MNEVLMFIGVFAIVCYVLMCIIKAGNIMADYESSGKILMNYIEEFPKMTHIGIVLTIWYIILMFPSFILSYIFAYVEKAWDFVTDKLSDIIYKKS